MNNWQDIKVSSKILGHVSAGIYRSPAGAIKELVSNAFDAEATRVVITTNWPSFDVITCRDNGSGMTEKKFKQIMDREIGNSTKRADSNDGYTPNQGRPIIGLLGIGMLGIAQICHEFKVISHDKKTETAFRASIRLPDFPGEFPNEKMDDISEDEASEQLIDVGQFRSDPIVYEPDNAGTYVVVSDVRSAFAKKFGETSGKDRLPSRFSEFLKQIHHLRSVNAISDYWLMVWELAVACPVPYINAGPFDWEKIEAESELKKQMIDLQQSLNRHQFEVVVDGLSLRKPNQYPLASPRMEKQEETTGKLFSVNEDLTVYGKSLKLSGYIYLQYSRAVEPMELRGLLVRIRNIAIGTYDPSLLAYPSVPTPRFNWISGEIYVDMGLESALNIDRDSFNEMSPHFVKLKSIIHTLLEEKVFPDAALAQRRRTQGRSEDKQHNKHAALQSLIHQELGGSYTVATSNVNPLPLTIDTDAEMIFENKQSSLLPKSKRKRDLIQDIAHAFEISMLAPEKKRREKFYQLLSELAKLDVL